MALIFVLLTQLINLTNFTIDFEVDRRRGLLPKLRRGKNRFAKPSRVLRWLRQYEQGWKIRVLVDGHFTGIELDPEIILTNVRVVFRVDGDVLCVEGAPENTGSDFFLRHRYFGCMRNLYWNKRALEPIDRSDSKRASQLRFQSSQKERSKENPLVQQDPPPPLKSPMRTKDNDNLSVQSNGTSTSQQAGERDDRHRPLKSSIEIGENDTKNMQHNGKSISQQARFRDDESFTNVVDKDSFVHGLMIVFSFIFCIFLKFLF